MSTKNLKRTLKEGGKTNSFKYNRKEAIAKERTRTRNYCKMVLVDPELADEIEIQPTRKQYKDYGHSFNALNRYIESNVGRVWNDVYSEMCKKFNINASNIGIKIYLDHCIDPNNNEFKFGGRFNSYQIVDGILQKVDSIPRVIRSFNKEYAQNVSDWLGQKLITEFEGKLHWVVPNEGIWKFSWFYSSKNGIGDRFARPLKYFHWVCSDYKEKYICDWFGAFQSINRVGYHWEEVDFPDGFRIRGELTDSELEYFDSLPEVMRNDILAAYKP